MTDTVTLLWSGRGDPGVAPVLVGVYTDAGVAADVVKAYRSAQPDARLYANEEHVRA